MSAGTAATSSSRRPIAGDPGRAISPDLTRNIKAHQQPAGGPITNDVSGAEYSDTILDIEGSTKSRGEIWVGTDDGLVQLTRDGGKHWTNVTPPGAPEFATLCDRRTLDARRGNHLCHRRRALYRRQRAIRLRHSRLRRSLDEDRRRAARGSVGTRDPARHPQSQHRLSRHRRGNLDFVRRRRRPGNLSRTACHPSRCTTFGMQPQYDDLVIATHGRDVYIMDDMTPVQQLMDAVRKKAGSSRRPSPTNGRCIPTTTASTRTTRRTTRPTA